MAVIQAMSESCKSYLPELNMVPILCTPFRLPRCPLLLGRKHSLSSGLPWVVGQLLLLIFVTRAHAVVQPPGLRANSDSRIEAVTIPFQSSGTLAQVRVLTQGVANADFVLNSPGTCIAETTFTVPSSCSIFVTFQPKAPGERRGAVVLLDSSGSVLAIKTLYGLGLGSVGVFTPATIATVAGNGQWLYTGDGEDATTSPIFLPAGIAVDPTGNFYIADSGNNRIRRVDGTGGVITTVAGTGSPGSGGDGGIATNASVSSPGALLLDGAGDLYIADSANHAIRKLSLATGKLTTIAGQLNRQGYSGDGGPATSAMLNTPEGLALDPSGNLYIADTKNHVIRKVDVNSGFINTYAGIGMQAGFSGDGGLATSASLNTPWGLASDAGGNIYIADLNNNRIRKVSSAGSITTVVGDGTTNYAVDGQSGTATSIDNPAAIVVDVAGNLYVADSGHNVVRKVNAVTGLTSTIAGSNVSTFTGDKGPATSAALYGPYGLTLDSRGDLYIADIFHHRIRQVQNERATLSYQPIRVGRTSAPQPQTIENDGNDSLNWSIFAADSNSAVSASSTTCTPGTPVAIDATCVIGAEFFPQVTGSKVTAAIKLYSDTVNTPITVTLSGEVDELEPTRITVNSSVNPSALGASVTFNASVSGDATQPSGNVRFYDGPALLGTAVTDSTGTGTFAISTLGLGSHTITANFTGDTLNSPSTSSALTQVVKRAPTVSLASNVNPSKVGESTTLIAAVTANGAQPTGNIVFSDGATTLATVPLNASGIASFTVSSLPAGTRTLTAAYTGDTNTLSGTSRTLAQAVNKWATAVTMGSSASTAVIGTPVILFVTVTASSVVPSGSVIFKDGAITLATVALDGTGAATFATPSLAVGTHSLTASFEGDTINAASESFDFEQTIQQISTVTTLASSANPVNGGATLHLTATVIPRSTNAVAGTLDGTVTFTEGTTVLGTGHVSATGSFTLDINSLSVAAHTIKATYNGNTNYASDTSVAMTQQVTLATSLVQLTSSANPTIAGNAITLTSLVSGNGAVPTGTVIFVDGTTSLGVATVNTSGQANLTVPALPAGSHAITATYGGDATDNISASSILIQIVNQANTAITLTANSNPALSGAPLTLVATLSSNGSVPQGQLLLRDGSAVIGNAVIGPTGAGQFTLSTLTPGLHTLTASFGGDTDHLASTSVAVAEVIQLATSTAALSSSQNPSAFGSAVTLSARITGTGAQPTGNVLFLDGSMTLANVTVIDGTASFSTPSLSIGSHVITLSYTGDATHSASATASLIERVQQSTTTTIVSGGSPSIVSNAVTFTATVRGASGLAITGSVSFYDAATLLGTSPLGAAGTAILQTSSLSAGTHLIAASYQGDDNDRASESTFLSHVVNTADTSVALASNVNPSVVGTAITFTANVMSRGQAASGQVTFLDGSVTLGTVNVTNGIASFSTTALNAGLHTIIARYGGDSSTQASTSNILLEVAQQHTTTALVSSLNPAVTDQSITLTAAIGNGSNPSGTVTFYDGAVALGTGAISSSGSAALTITSLAAGAHSISVHYSGDSYNLASDSAGIAEIVQFRSTTTSMTASSPGYLDGQQVTLVAVVHFTGPVSPTGTVIFTANGETLGATSVTSAGAATLTFEPSARSYDIVATYSGDAVYSGSTANSYNIAKGSSTTFSITSDPSAFSLKSGDHRTLTLTLTDTGTFSDTVSLGCLDLPIDATCTFLANQAKLSAGRTATIQVVFDTGHPLGSGVSASARPIDERSRGIAHAEILFPAAISFGILLVGARRGRRLYPLLSVVLLAVASLSVTGCGNSLNTSTTPPGSFNVRIIASGNQSGISQIANVAITVQ